MHTFLKTAYVHFRLPSLVERAHIPRESISARLPASPLRPLPPVFPQPLIDHLSFSYSLFPPAHGFTPSLILSHGCCTFFGTPCTGVPPLGGPRSAERSGVKQGGRRGEGEERRGRPPLMNVILRKGRERNTAARLPPLVPLHPFLPPTHSPSPRPCPPHARPSPPPHPTTIFSPLSTSTTSTYQPLLRFSTPAATSLPSRHTTTKHSI